MDKGRLTRVVVLAEDLSAGLQANTVASRGAHDLRYLGVGLCDDKKLLNRLTGSLPLLR